MASEGSVRGFLLEEVLAWLLRNNGYQLITAPIPGDPGLEMTGAGLGVHGRGARHQADVLGEFPFTPPFSLPIRMFVEAKSIRDEVGLDIVRGAWAVVNDVNQFDVGTSPYRYRYVYTLFSTSGFTEPAAAFAVVHQISLIDLTLPEYAELRAAAADTASAITHLVQGTGSVERLRRIARSVLRTADEPLPPAFPGRRELRTAIQRLEQRLQASFGTEILLAFPPAPFVLALAGDISRFLNRAARDDRVNIFRDPDDDSGWVVQPTGGEDFRLRFSLPPHVEEWLMADRRHQRQMKQTTLSTMTIYHLDEGIPRSYQLRYEPRS